jgi:hypothetical protein
MGRNHDWVEKEVYCEYDNYRAIMKARLIYEQEDDISALWTEAAGRPILSASIDDAGLDKLEGHFRSVLDPAWARDLRLVRD